MFLKHRKNGGMIDVNEMTDLTNLFHKKVIGRYQAGEELQDPEEFNKADLVFYLVMNLPVIGQNPTTVNLSIFIFCYIKS